MKVVVNSIIFVLLMVISSCQSDPYAGDFTTRQPNKSDVIGIYQFKEQTISEAPIDKPAKKKIVFFITRVLD